MSVLTRTHCHDIARDLLISAYHERELGAKRTFLRLSRAWVQLAMVARRDGPLRFRGRSA